MTETEWLACTDAEKMMKFLWKSEKITDRKRRLFGVAVCQRIWNYLTDERSRTAVEVAAKYADGEATLEELTSAYDAAFDVADALTESKDGDPTSIHFREKIVTSLLIAMTREVPEKKIQTLAPPARRPTWKSERHSGK